MKDTLISLAIIAFFLIAVVYGITFEAVRFLAWWHIAFGGHHA